MRDKAEERKRGFKKRSVRNILQREVLRGCRRRKEHQPGEEKLRICQARGRYKWNSVLLGGQGPGGGGVGGGGWGAIKSGSGMCR